jgi:toxin ParE1/3/4
MKYRLSDFAATEVEVVVEYYSHRSRGLVIGFIEELTRVLTILVVNPYIGQATGDHYRHFPLKRFPYHVIYQIEAELNRVSIVSVSHQRRAPDYWRDGIQEEPAIYRLAA